MWNWWLYVTVLKLCSSLNFCHWWKRSGSSGSLQVTIVLHISTSQCPKTCTVSLTDRADSMLLDHQSETGPPSLWLPMRVITCTPGCWVSSRNTWISWARYMIESHLMGTLLNYRAGFLRRNHCVLQQMISLLIWGFMRRCTLCLLSPQLHLMHFLSWHQNLWHRGWHFLNAN